MRTFRISLLLSVTMFACFLNSVHALGVYHWVPLRTSLVHDLSARLNETDDWAALAVALVVGVALAVDFPQELP